MINRVLFTIIAATVLSQFSMSGQKSPERVQPERVLEEGKLLFERGYYGLARETLPASGTWMPASHSRMMLHSLKPCLLCVLNTETQATCLKSIWRTSHKAGISLMLISGLGNWLKKTKRIHRHFVALRRLTPTTLTRMYALSFIISLATPTLSTVTIIKPQDTLLWSRMLTPNTVHRHPITMPTYFMKRRP